MSELSGNSGELKPCPFCGSVPELGEHNVAHSSWQPRYDVACRNDKCIMQRTYKTQALAVADWNTRPVEDELLKKFEQLQAQWDAIPWRGLWTALRIAYEEIKDDKLKTKVGNAMDWHEAFAPHERPTDEQLQSLAELIRKA